MKYRLPQGCGGLSHAGKAVAVAADGSFELGAAAATLLEPHGIVPVGDPAPVDPRTIAGMARADIVAALTARSMTAAPDASDAALRGLLRQALAKPSR